MKNFYATAKEAVNEAEALIFLAGAGMGVDSGLPDFRGNQGFWKAYPPIAKMGLSFEEMANPRWFDENPKMAWAFYGHRFNLYKKTVPHAAFEMLLNAGKLKKYGYFVYTSNVDGQFQKAGFDENRMLEIHGAIEYFQCQKPCSQEIWKAQNTKIQIDMQKFEAQNPLPNCPKCGGLSRPNILMFGDWHWLSNRSDNQHVLYDNWLEELKQAKARVVLIEMGAGKAVPSVRMQSSKLIRYLNATLVRINPRDYDLPDGNHFSFATGALEGIRQIL
jgi:NAD-dependent SIR2 family protein deacetylase